MLYLYTYSNRSVYIISPILQWLQDNHSQRDVAIIYVTKIIIKYNHLESNPKSLGTELTWSVNGI